MTPKRKHILDIVKNSCDHLTAEQIFFEMKRELPGVAMATVYNNLNYLAGNGFIRRVKIAGEPDRFDKTLTPHEHALCDSCKKVIDICTDDIKKKIEEQYNIELTSCSLNLHFICDECSGRGVQ